MTTSPTRRKLGRFAAAGAAAVAVSLGVLSGAGAVAAAPTSPVFPQIEQGNSVHIGDYTVTMLTKAQTRDLWNAGLPQFAGDRFEAEIAFRRALSTDGAGCVVFGYKERDDLLSFTFIRNDGEAERSDSPYAKIFNEANFRCV